MPTQEERLQVVEYDLKHFKTETIKAYGDMATESVIIKGLTMDSMKRLIGVEKTLDRVETTLSEHTNVLQEHTSILQEHSSILQEHTARFSRLETTLGEQTTLLTEILARLPEKP